MRILSYCETLEVSGSTSTNYIHTILQNTLSGALGGLGTALATRPPSWKPPILAGVLSGAFSGIGVPIYEITYQKISELIK